MSDGGIGNPVACARPKRSCRLLAYQQSLRVAGKTAHRAQRHVADNARNPQIFVIEERAGDLLIIDKVRADEASEVVDLAAHLPAFHHCLDRSESTFETAAVGLLLQNDLGKHV